MKINPVNTNVKNMNTFIFVWSKIYKRPNNNVWSDLYKMYQGTIIPNNAQFLFGSPDCAFPCIELRLFWAKAFPLNSGYTGFNVFSYVVVVAEILSCYAKDCKRLLLHVYILCIV